MSQCIIVPTTAKIQICWAIAQSDQTVRSVGNYESNYICVDTEDSDQTERMPRLI